MNIGERVPVMSVIIPAYNAAGHIEKALMAIFAGFDSAVDWDPEVIVADDGSTNSEAQASACLQFLGVQLLHHDHNRGICASRNTGISDSRGDFVTLLEADDEFVTDRFSAFRSIMDEWPEQANVCFTPCINDAGEHTCARPDYKGWPTAEDMVLEHMSGDYNSVFLGAFIRRGSYADLGTRKSCGSLTYLRMAREAPLWIIDKVQRLYHDAVEQSVTRGWTRPDKAAETHRCFVAALEEHGVFIKGVAEWKCWQMCYKSLIYRILAREGRDIGLCWRAFSRRGLKSWLATLVLLLIGRVGTTYLLVPAKHFGVLRRYG